MIGMNPPDIPAASSLDGVFALLAVIADPAAAKKNATAIKNAMSDLDKKQADLRATEQKIIDERKELDKRSAQIAAEVLARDTAMADIDKKTADLTANMAAFAVREQAVKDAEAANKQRSDELARSEASMSAREKRMTSREDAVTKREAAVTAQEEDFSRRMASLKALAG